MKYGIYYAYWEKQWGVDYVPYAERVSRLGFDILEISCAGVSETSKEKIKELQSAADYYGITLTGGYGPKASENIASEDPAVRKNAIKFWADTFPVLEKLGIRSVGGGLYSYWPVDYGKPIDKQAEWHRSIEGVKTLSLMAEDYGITLNMEVLNRFEGFLLNTAAEGVEFVKAVDRPNVKVMLDTFHMNIEEDSFIQAIRQVGRLLGRLHIGEANRRLPGQGGRIPWYEIGRELSAWGYEGDVVMEPFVLQGGQVGRDIKVWRDLSNGATRQQLDEDAKQSLRFIKFAFEGR